MRRFSNTRDLPVSYFTVLFISPKEYFQSSTARLSRLPQSAAHLSELSIIPFSQPRCLIREMISSHFPLKDNIIGFRLNLEIIRSSPRRCFNISRISEVQLHGAYKMHCLVFPSGESLICFIESQTDSALNLLNISERGPGLHVEHFDQ